LQTNLELVTGQIKNANRLLLRADAFCLSDPTCPFSGEGKGSVPKVLASFLSRYNVILSVISQAYATIQQMASNGTLGNVSIDDVSAITTVYFSGSPLFSTFNEAVFGALNGDTSGFDWAAITPQFTAGLFGLLPFLCSDWRECLDS